MVKADMHVHSKFSDHASEWFLRKIGAKESYVEPEEIYKKAKENGMDFVTITDHNKIKGSIELNKKFPRDTFTGVEITSYFPEDGCKIHILIYNISYETFLEIDAIRSNIYELRDYIKVNSIVYSVAHAFYSINNKLTKEHVEKLILLFDVFENLNGSRDSVTNDGLSEILLNLTPDYINHLKKKHMIEPLSIDPWIKGFTGGSDDHAGLFAGRAFTVTKHGAAKEDFLENIRNKHSISNGRNNNYKNFVFTIYKIALDYSKAKGIENPDSIFHSFNELFFKNDKRLIKKLKYRFLVFKEKGENGIKKSFYRLVNKLSETNNLPIEVKFNHAYSEIAELTDTYFKILVASLEKNMKKGEPEKIIKDISSFLPSFFIVAPFFTSLKHMFRGRLIVDKLKKDLLIKKTNKKILWFTDTIDDLNGVSETIKKVSSIAEKKSINLMVLASTNNAEKIEELSGNIKAVPSVYSFKVLEYEKITLKVPSLLKSIELIYDFNPDEIVISTPGPVGLLGMLASKLLCVKSINIYHTDYSIQVSELIGEEDIVNLVNAYTRWFYNLSDKIMVPTKKYLNILKDRSYDSSKIQLYSKGIDTEVFTRTSEREYLRDLFGFSKNSKLLLYVGRISKDKNIDFIFSIFSKLFEKDNTYKLIFVGDGPYLEEVREKYKNFDEIKFLGRVKRSTLPLIYTSSDLLLFPSVSDTFGMVVLEAASCALPSVVSDQGGPSEIVLDNSTGFICKVSNPNDWVEKIELFFKVMKKDEVTRMKKRSQIRAARKYSWEKSIKSLLNIDIDKTNFSEIREKRLKENNSMYL